MAPAPAILDVVSETSETSVALAPVLNFERLAANPSVDVAKLERLIAMHEHVLALQARTAFNQAFALMAAEIPTLVAATPGDGGKWTYAPLEQIQTAVRPILVRHGFGLSFRTEWPDPKTIRVVGILTHRDGHERESAFVSPADTSGSKNAVQALGSTISYGRRYTTNDLLNITTKGADDDARTAVPPAPTTPRGPVQHPSGFLRWRASLDAAARVDLPALEQAYLASTKELRLHLKAVGPDVLQTLKLAATTRGAQ